MNTALGKFQQTLTNRNYSGLDKMIKEWIAKKD
jgi:hypothetical protein